ncbi:MAG: hypothetical protein JW953_01500 [Anaerolineae bacterium]|nr:hypothetical protein [Anaerolineae bacterium]
MFRPYILFDADGGGGNSGTPPSTPPAEPPADPPAPEGDGVPRSWDEVFQHQRFKELNSRAKKAEAELQQLQEAEKKRSDKEAAEQGKWQQLAEQREIELKTERLKRQQLEIASKKGLPPDLAPRLRGDTVEEMEADADILLTFMKPGEGPGVPPAGRGSGSKPLDLSKMTPKEIREKKEQLWAQEIGQ